MHNVQMSMNAGLAYTIVIPKQNVQTRTAATIAIAEEVSLAMAVHRAYAHATNNVLTDIVLAHQITSAFVTLAGLANHAKFHVDAIIIRLV